MPLSFDVRAYTSLFIAPKEKNTIYTICQAAIFVEAKSCSGKYLWLEDALCLRDSGQARSF